MSYLPGSRAKRISRCASNAGPVRSAWALHVDNIKPGQRTIYWSIPHAVMGEEAMMGLKRLGNLPEKISQPPLDVVAQPLCGGNDLKIGGGGLRQVPVVQWCWTMGRSDAVPAPIRGARCHGPRHEGSGCQPRANALCPNTLCPNTLCPCAWCQVATVILNRGQAEAQTRRNAVQSCLPHVLSPHPRAAIRGTTRGDRWYECEGGHSARHAATRTGQSLSPEGSHCLDGQGTSVGRLRPRGRHPCVDHLVQTRWSFRYAKKKAVMSGGDITALF